MHRLDLLAIRRRRHLSEVVRAHGIDIARRAGAWAGRCPFHREKTPSFVAYDDGHFHCYGCDAHGDVIDFIRRIEGLSFTDAVAQLARGAGVELLHDNSADAANGFRRQARSNPDPDRRHRAQRELGTKLARTIWRSALRAEQTAGACYLLTRGITTPIPASVRFAPLLKHRETDTSWPALVCAIQAIDRRVVAIQRLFLRRDGAGKAPVSPNKMSLGAFKGGALRLAPAAPRLGLAEGLETGLSVMQLTGTPVWVACGGANMASVILPAEVQEVVIYGDNGERGHAFAERAAKRFHDEGRRVKLAFPPAEFDDFNDLLRNDVVPEARAA